MKIKLKKREPYIAAVIERGHLYYLNGTKKTASTKDASRFEKWTQAKDALKEQGYLKSNWIIFEEDFSPAVKWKAIVSSSYGVYTFHGKC